MRRRAFVWGGSAVAALLLLGNGCAPRRAPRVGVLAPDDGAGARWDAFRAGLRELGWVDGQNVTLMWRAANGANEALQPYAEELANAKVDVLVTGGTEAA